MAGQSLLHLGAASEDIDSTGDLADADDTPFGHVTDVGLAVEGQEVMLAKAVERDVLEDNHLFVGFLKPGCENRKGVLEQPREQLGVHLGDALRRVQQTFTARIFSDSVDDLARGGDDTLMVDPKFGGQVSGGWGSHIRT